MSHCRTNRPVGAEHGTNFLTLGGRFYDEQIGHVVVVAVAFAVLTVIWKCQFLAGTGECL